MKKKELSDEDHLYMTEVLAELADIFKDEIELLEKATGKQRATCLGDLMRPFFRDAFQSVRAVDDKRMRMYGARVRIWDIDEGMDRGELMEEFDNFECAGMAAIGDGIREKVGEIHNTDAVKIEGFGLAKLDGLLKAHRVAMTNGGGYATKRIKYEFNATKHMMEAAIWRVDQDKA